MDSIAASAARNNAVWCDIVARAHRSATTTDDRAWTSEIRTPPYYPDAVTLAPDVRPAEVLDRVDASIGCSVKDSFATLDLHGFGFAVLFDASWFSRELGQTARLASDWHSATTDGELAEWERAWRGDEGPPDVLVDEILRDERVTVGQLRSSGRLVAGAVFTASDGVVGITNFFAEPQVAGRAWATCVAFADEQFGGATLVGYGTGGELEAALGSDFTDAGPLRVWVRTR